MALSNLSLKSLTIEARYWQGVLRTAAPNSGMYEVASFNLNLLRTQVNEVRASLQGY